MNTNLDHLVIGASSLEQGVAYVKAQLGVDMPKGGEHPAMGTHNHLMQLGNDVFLEVITINPAAPAPERPRWYGLDDPFVQRRIAQQPQLLTWVINTTDLVGLQGQTNISFGDPTALTRDDLRWQFAVPDDGRLLAGGMLPYLIQWETQPHPAQRMADVGCRLHSLEIYHPYPEWLYSILTAIDAAKFVKIKPLGQGETPYLSAQIMTPSGLKQLRR